MINLEYPAMLDLFREHLDPKRSESASFLVWYLENYYRLDELECIDCVCDQKGDKGVDGIYVSDIDETIYIFQTKISQTQKSSIGDSELKKFSGTLKQFKNKDTVTALINSAKDSQVAKLCERFEIADKVETYKTSGIFICNLELDSNGLYYLKNIDIFQYIGKKELEETYISKERNHGLRQTQEFDLTGYISAEYVVDTEISAVIVPLKAIELVKMDGIQNQSIFDYNVRGHLGNTKVNKDIVRSIKDVSLHKYFPLFHNGITIICSEYSNKDNILKIENYFVVNGCQSLTSLYKNKSKLTDGLTILCKIIKIPNESDLITTVTKYSNNQNGVKARDFKANNHIQIRLQNDISKNYGSKYFYEVKRGETPANKIIISNELAGILFIAFDLKEPWTTHRKYQVFDEKHNEIFARPEVTSHRIVFLFLLNECVQMCMPKIENTLFQKYVLTKYFIIYLVGCILEGEPVGKVLIENPEPFIKGSNSKILEKILITMIEDIIIDLNSEILELGVDFDYRGKLRDKEWVTHKGKEIVSSYLKQVSRQRIPSFSVEWEKSISV